MGIVGGGDRNRTGVNRDMNPIRQPTAAPLIKKGERWYVGFLRAKPSPAFKRLKKYPGAWNACIMLGRQEFHPDNQALT